MLDRLFWSSATAASIAQILTTGETTRNQAITENRETSNEKLARDLSLRCTIQAPAPTNASESTEITNESHVPKSFICL